uniref:Uncharacterized protein n=1 Tax=Arundo donax TaxID=35708 RepID=A0A0A9E7M6_ARUDO
MLEEGFADLTWFRGSTTCKAAVSHAKKSIPFLFLSRYRTHVELKKLQLCALIDQ